MSVFGGISIMPFSPYASSAGTSTDLCDHQMRRHLSGNTVTGKALAHALRSFALGRQVWQGMQSGTRSTNGCRN